MKWKGMKQGTEGFLRRHWSGYVSLALALMLFAGLLPQTAQAAMTNTGDSNAVTITAAKVGYTSNAQATITVNSDNSGDTDSIAWEADTEKFDVTPVSPFTASQSSPETLTVKAKSGLGVGTHETEITLTDATNNVTAKYQVSFEVEHAITVDWKSGADGDFGSVIADGTYERPAAEVLEVKNEGESEVTLGAISVEGYEITVPDSGKIAAAATAEVKFQPEAGLAAKDYSASNVAISYTVDGVTGTQTLENAFSVGFEVEAADYNVTATNVDFGQVLDDYTAANAAAQDITLTNNSNVDVYLTALPENSNYTINTSATAENSGDFDGMYKIGTSGTITVSVQPKTGLAIKNYDTTLSFALKSAGKEDLDPVTADVKFEVAQAKRSIAAVDGSETVTEVDFKSVVAGADVPASKDLVIKNTGNADVIVYTPTAKNFTITYSKGEGTNSGTQTTLKAGQTATYAVQPKNTTNSDKEDKVLNEDITFKTDAGSAIKADVTLKYTIEANTYAIGGSKNAVSFEDAIVDDAQPSAETIQITNGGNTDATLKYDAPTNYDITPNDGAGTVSKNNGTADGSLNVTIRPKSSIMGTAGDYKEEIRFYFDDDNTQEYKVTVNFKVVDKTYIIKSDVTTVDLGTLASKYTEDAAKSLAQKITLTNTGNTNLTDVAIALDSDVNYVIDTDKNGGAIATTNTLNANDSSSKVEFYIYPKEGSSLNVAGTSSTFPTAKIQITSATAGADLKGTTEIPVSFKTSADATYTAEATLEGAAITDAVEFDALVAGYAASPAAKTITIKNTGTAALNVASGTGNENFTYTTLPTSGTIQPQGTLTFDVTPSTGLAPGTYQDDIVITFTEQQDGEAVKLELSFTVEVQEKTWKVEADATSIVFDEVEPDYDIDDITAKEVTIKNTGNQSVTVTSVDAGEKFTATIAAGGNNVLAAADDTVIYEVKPVADLASGIHEGTLVIKTNQSSIDDIEIPVTFTVAAKYDITVTPKDGGSSTATASPTSASAGTEITLTATAADGYEFDKWEVVSGGASIADPTAASTKINQMPASAVEINAIFKQKEEENNNSGTGDSSGTGSSTDSGTGNSSGTGSTDSGTGNSSGTGSTDSGTGSSTTPSTPNADGGWKKNNTGWWFKYTTPQNGKAYPRAQWEHINNKWYHFDAEGYMETGWLKVGSKWYYLDPKNGDMKTGWIKDGGVWYYLNTPNGDMRTGWLQEGDLWYYLKGNGAMATGWQKVGNTWYYLNTKSGAMQTGWLKDAGKWYYLQSNGAMKTGWLQEGSTWYYLQGSGAMKTGWLQYKGTWYYLQGSGAMLANTSRAIGGKTYNFNASGACTNPY